MPDSERELKIRHTSEGAEKVRADIQSVAGAEQKLGDAVGDAGKSTDDLRVKTEDLSRILNRIHPALGGYAETLVRAVQAAGKLGNANLDLGAIIGGVTSAITKNAGALKLLGAGGLAVGSVIHLIGKFKSLKAELEDVLRLQEKIAAQNVKLIDKSRAADELLVSAVESGDIAPPNEQERKRIRSVTQQFINEGFSPQVAFEIATNRRPPPSDAQREFVRDVRGVDEIRQRVAEELGKGKDLGSRELDFIKQQGFTEDDVKRLRDIITRGTPEKPGVFIQPKPLTPDEFQTKEPQLYELATRLGLLKLTIERLQQPVANPEGAPPTSAQRKALGPWGSPQRWKRIQDERTGPDTPAPTTQSDDGQARRPADDTEQRQTAAMLREAARDLNQSAREIRTATESMANQADRSAQRLSRNGATPRMVAAMGREG